MVTSVNFQPVSLGLSNYKTYLFVGAFIIGNLLFPQLAHLIPEGGKMLLPIYFFTLIAGYKFGFRVGLLTAIFSPIVNNILFGMPPVALLPVILIKSSLLAVGAAWVASESKKVSVFHLLAVVLIYQVLGAFAELAITQSTSMALQDFRIGVPGMLVQILGGWLILNALAKYEC